MAGWNQPLDGPDSSINGFAPSDETTVKKIPPWNDDDDLLADQPGQSGPAHQFSRDDDQLSSVPTVVEINRFRDNSSLDDYSL